jgi:hypothetical protein
MRPGDTGQERSVDGQAVGALECLVGQLGDRSAGVGCEGAEPGGGIRGKQDRDGALDGLAAEDGERDRDQGAEDVEDRDDPERTDVAVEGFLSEIFLDVRSLRVSNRDTHLL